MSDNIFDRLAELLSASGPVNWGLAGELATSVAGDPGTVPAAATAQWTGLVDTASRMLSDASVIELTAPPVEAVDRRSWAAGTLRRFNYLAEPLASKLAADQANPFGPVFSIMVGLQIGSMVGSMSHRALAHFDAPLPPLGAERVRFAEPNVADFIASHDLEAQQARLWIAAHELVQHCVLRRPALADRLRSLVSTYIGGLELDESALPFEGLESGFDPERISQMVQDPSFLTGMFTGPRQAEDLAEIRAFFATVEGYTGHLLDSLDTNLMPELGRIREAVERRRATPSQGEVMLQRMLGIELRRVDARRGIQFFAEIDRRYGPEVAETVFEGGEAMPTDGELDDPVGWAARTLLT